MAAHHGCPSALEERPAAPENHGCRERQLDPVQRPARQKMVQRPARQEFRHHERENRRGHHERPAEPPRHVVELFVGLLLERDRDRLQCHAADRAGAGSLLAHLRMHRARVLGLWIRDGGRRRSLTIDETRRDPSETARRSSRRRSSRCAPCARCGRPRRRARSSSRRPGSSTSSGATAADRANGLTLRSSRRSTQPLDVPCTHGSPVAAALRPSERPETPQRLAFTSRTERDSRRTSLCTPFAQKWYVFPLYWLLPAAFSGSTCIPHTTSFSMFVLPGLVRATYSIPDRSTLAHP